MQLPSKQEGRSDAEVFVALQIHHRGKKGVDEGESNSTRSCSEINNPDGTRVTVISDPRMLCGQPRRNTDQTGIFEGRSDFFALPADARGRFKLSIMVSFYYCLLVTILAAVSGP